jgi:acyl-coenzyme A synthetase/AMP-(fatty) acid ligase
MDHLVLVVVSGIASGAVYGLMGLGLLRRRDRHLAERGLTKGKWPEYVWRVPALPQNRVGKLSRADAARIARELKDHSVATR